jgi:monovalent cation/hydrogen antiporter
MHLAVAIVAIVAGVGVVAGLCNRLGWPTPLVLLVVGVAVSYVPGVPTVRIDPDLVLNGLLPPLLFAATAKLSLFDFRRDVTATLLMSVGLVLVTTASVGLVAWWLLPGASLAAGLAIGAVVAPPDAVATTAIGHRLGLPRKITSLLEKESLLNDATSLVALGLAVTATTSSVGIGDVAFDIFRSVGGGVAVGAVVAAVLVMVRKHLDDPVLDTTLSFAAPYIAFLPAEEIKASGVLAVVITGLVLAHLSPTLQNASSRLAEATNWRTIAFLLENAVFLLIGLQLPSLLSGARHSDLGAGTIVAVCAGVFLATVLTRFVFVFVAREAFTVGTKKMRLAAWPLRGSTVIGWAGMRGVVTLAAALLLPEKFIHRDVVLLAAFTVVAGTLLVQGLSLPWLARRLNLPRPDPAEDALQAAELTERSTRRGLRKLEEMLEGSSGGAVPDDVIETLRHRASVRSNAAWERLGRPLEDLMTPSAMYSKLRTKMLAAEREEIVLARDTGAASDEVLRSALAAVDQEESMLERVEELDALTDDRELTPGHAEAPCSHLAEAPAGEGQPPAHECPDCLREGTTWVHLRRCLACGAVGCCDSSTERHAFRHFQATQHPVMRSAEPGEAWRWCWIDEVVG